jgi:hypothetical protein
MRCGVSCAVSTLQGSRCSDRQVHEEQHNNPGPRSVVLIAIGPALSSGARLLSAHLWQLMAGEICTTLAPPTSTHCPRPARSEGESARVAARARTVR